MRFLKCCWLMLSRVLRAVFSKKGIFVFGCLLALVGAVAVVYHVVYNYTTERSWELVKERWENQLEGKTREDLFPEIPDHLNIGKDERVVAYFQKEEPPLDRMKYMPLEEYSEHEFRMTYDKDMFSCFDEDAFASEVEAATYLLRILENFDDEVSLFEDWFDRDFCLESNFVEPLNLDDLKEGEMYPEMAYMSIVHFFSERAKYRLIAQKYDEANDDLRRVANAYASLSNDSLLVNYLVKLAYLGELRDLFARGIREHRWSRDSLLRLRNSIEEVNLIQNFRNMPAAEYIYFADFMNLYQVHGQQAVDSALFGQYEEMQSILSGEYNSAFIDWDLLVLKITRAVLPDTILLRGGVDKETFALDYAVPAYLKEPHVSVYQKLEKLVPEYPWWRLTVD